MSGSALLRRSRRLVILVVVLPWAWACAALSGEVNLDALTRQVTDAERAFARTMADRDHTAFTAFLSEEAVFLTGEVPVRGRAAVAEAWRPYFDGADVPFSWQPERVEVLDSGALALSTGPVFDPDGKLIGRFTSIWRREAGRWRVVFDRGCPVCLVAAPPT
jgi:ketosteroid isomerase-like protein